MTTQQNPSQAQGDDAARPDFLQMDGAQSADAQENTDSWYGWPHRKVEPVTLLRPDGKTERVRTPVMELEGLITPTELHYVVQHFGVPDTVAIRDWSLAVDGEVKKPLRLTYDDVRRFPLAFGSHRDGMFRQRRNVLRVLQGRGPSPLPHSGAHDPVG